MVGISSQIGHSQRRVPVEVFRLDEALEQVPTHRGQSLSIVLFRGYQASVARLQCLVIDSSTVYRKKTPRLSGLLASCCGVWTETSNPPSPDRVHLPMHRQHHRINRYCCCTRKVPLISLPITNPFRVCYVQTFDLSPIGPGQVQYEHEYEQMHTPQLTLHSCPRLYCPATRRCLSTRSKSSSTTITASIYTCVQIHHNVNDRNHDLSCDQHNHDPLQVFTCIICQPR